jgi:hypothetical protein
MGNAATATPRVADGRPFHNPWPAVLGGLAAGLLACAWVNTAADSLVLGRIVLLAAGLLAVGAGIAIRPASPAVLGVSALAGFLLGNGMSPAWDTVRLMVHFLTAVATAAAVLMLLPRVVRRVAVSLLILFHFGGILTAVTTVPPQPWLSLVVWTHVYRPYLEFMYLNNAYHFYSPDPGPATLAWFRVQYEDGTARWIKIPNRDEYPMAINYQRRLALTESINLVTPPGPIFPPGLVERRLRAVDTLGIPLHPDLLPLNRQYGESTRFSQLMLQTFARHVARTYPHLEDPAKKVIAVKIYRVVHAIPDAPRLVLLEGHLDDPTLYQVFYEGEFSPDGELVNPQDPLLYWVVPIIRVPRSGVALSGPETPDPRPIRLEDTELRNYVEIHAGDRVARP